MKSKTISLICAFNVKGLLAHLYRKHIVDRLFLGLVSFCVPSITRFLTPASLETDNNGLFPKPKASDITDHLPVLFCEAVKTYPKLIVELGTRGGDSTQALIRAASVSGAKMLSIDIEDCGNVVNMIEFEDVWRFHRADDVDFAREFPTWCSKNGFPTSVDLLFIDTSHEYEHTQREIESWFPLLSEKCKVIFHDTNMRLYFKLKNGRILKGLCENRDVIKALEVMLNKNYDESVPFLDIQNNWLIEHFPHSSGLTILTRARKE